MINWPKCIQHDKEETISFTGTVLITPLKRQKPRPAVGRAPASKLTATPSSIPQACMVEREIPECVL